ncbi:hypothetical protein ACHAXR_010649 [Thalassiosira sp. AJA248-18]
MEHILSQAAAELAIRSEVESTLTSLLQDVEHAHTLEQSLRAHNELHQCREKFAALKVRYEDREAAWVADRREKERLGMLLLDEIVKLSAREVEGEKNKREMELKLEQMEDDKRRGTVLSAAPCVEKEDVKIKDDAGQKVSDEKGDKVVSESSNNNSPSDDLGERQVITDAANDDKEKMVEGSSDATPAAADDTSASTATDQRFVPHSLNETTLMNIFAYADPLDVMNFAQTNKALLSKVNVMFGMGSGEEESDANDEQQQTSGSEEHVAAAAAAAASVEKTEPEPEPSQPTAAASASVTSTAGQAVSSSSLAVTGATKNNTAPATPAKSSPKLFGMPGPSHRRQGSGASVATAGSAGSANRFSQVSSWFGGNDASSVAAATNAATASTAAMASSDMSASGSSEIKLNAAMATSMASKLTPAELSIILRMREKLQKCEADANKWRHEKEDALGNLASVEAVKEFLVARVRDTERVVQKQKEDMRAVERKSLEDQEVIVFLDERVKELEKVVEETKSKEAATKQESLEIVNKNEKKARVLSDMLRFEREQMASNEKEWKTAKKVLVKEVKSCRARIVALEAELDGCRRQNSQLKQGLLSLTQSSGSMSPGGKKYNMKNISRH